MKLFKCVILLFAVAVCGCLVSCSDSDDAVAYPDKTLTVGDTFTISSGNGWTSINENIASVSGRVVTAERVGAVLIYNSKDEFTVTVEPNYYTYMEPCMNWGATKSTVKTFMKDFTIYSEDTDLLAYEGAYKEILSMYGFSGGKLILSCVTVRASDVTAEEMSYYLNERYIYEGQAQTTDGETVLLFSSVEGTDTIELMASVLSTGTVVYMIYYLESSRSYSIDECVAMTASFATPLKDNTVINRVRELLNN